MSIRIETRLGIQASAERIWEVLSNLDRWEGWNPVYPRASGKIVIGGTLELLEKLPGGPERSLRAKVVDWTPHAQLILRIDEGFATHRLQYFEIDPLDPTASIFAAGIFFNGWGAKGAAKRLGRSAKLGFGLMGEALKAKVEAA
jgi:hypothetical protein